MEKKVFDTIWTLSIKKVMRSIEEKNISLRDSSDSIVWREYEKIRSDIHTHMFDANSNIDRHKVGAAIAEAILNVKPFEVIFRDNIDAPKTAIFANELLALNAAIIIVWNFTREVAEKDGNHQRLEDIKKGFIFPPDSHGISYIMHTAKLMYYARERKIFDVFMFSNILYMIEQYTIEKVKADRIVGAH